MDIILCLTDIILYPTNKLFYAPTDIIFEHEFHSKFAEECDAVA